MSDPDEATVRRIRRHADAIGGSVPTIQPVVRRARTKTWLRRVSSGAAVAMVTVAVLLPLKVLTGLGDHSQPRARPSNQLMYVIDGAPNGQASNGEVVAVAVGADAARSRVVARYPLGSDIDIALSPDGRRLYGVAWVWAGNRTKSMLQVYDTGTANLLQQTPLPNWQGTTGFHLTNKIAIAPDGSRVWVMVNVPAHSGTGPSAGLSTFDATSGVVLPGIVPLDGCGSVPTILPLSAHDLVVVCRQINEVRFLRVSDSGRLTGDDRLALSTSGASVSVNPLDVGYVSQAVLSSDRGTLYAVTRDGSVLVIDVGSRTIEQQVHLSLPAGEYVPVPQVRLTPDGGVLLVGLGAGGDAIHADTILAIDTATWEQIGQVHTDPFSAFDVSSDGLAVFTIDFDNPALREVAVPPAKNNVGLGDVASKPQAIYVAASPQDTSSPPGSGSV